jgi:hypothetical protein
MAQFVVLQWATLTLAGLYLFSVGALHLETRLQTPPTGGNKPAVLLGLGVVVVMGHALVIHASTVLVPKEPFEAHVFSATILTVLAHMVLRRVRMWHASTGRSVQL